MSDITRMKTSNVTVVAAFTLVIAGVLAMTTSAFAQFSAPLDVPPPGPAATERVPILKDAGLDQRLNEQVPLDAMFVDDHGRDVRLGDYLGKRPVVLVLAYYDCPMLCTQVISGAVGSLQTLSLDAGRDFEFVVVSFNPGDTPTQAREKKAGYLPRYGRPGADAGFHFLTGRPEAIKQLSAAIGFRYVYDPKIDQYAHPAVITVLTPGGRVSRYLLGIEYPPRDLRLALVEAAGGKIGNAVDAFLLYCYHYDPMSGRYGLAILNLVRAGGLLTLVALALFVTAAMRRERHGRVVMPPVTGVR
jgi:protein SCO1/2